MQILHWQQLDDEGRRAALARPSAALQPQLLRRVERRDVRHGPLERGNLPGQQRRAGGGELRRTHRQAIQPHLVETLGQPQQRGIAFGADRADEAGDIRGDVGARLKRRPRQRGAAAGRIQFLPVQNAHDHTSIFSTGSTSMALAPAFFRLSSVSQNTFSRHTACTATRSG